MTDKQREVMALRTIVVSGRSALSKTTEPDERERIQDRVHDLLAELEQQVIRDGADQELLSAIERKRRQLFDD